MAQLNEWLTISKTSGTGNAEITLTASSSKELTQRIERLIVKGQSKKVYVNVIQNAVVPSVTLDNYEINDIKGGGVYMNGITSNVPWTAVVSGDWITIDKTQGESGYTPLSITLDASRETRSGSIIFKAEGVVLTTLQIYQTYDFKTSYFWVEFDGIGGTVSNMDVRYVNCKYSLDGSTWKTTPNTLSMGNNTLVFFKGDGLKDKTDRIEMNSVNAKIGGDLSSLSPDSSYVGWFMFQDNINLTDASELILPWTTLATGCYSYMFDGCKNLVSPPELPATTLAEDCYSAMFEGCGSLTTAPELPATTLASNCYNGMFVGCGSLTTAPELPATTLAEGCYITMFWNCTNLTTAPKLPATTLADACYASMFWNCTSLVNTPELPATTLAERCYSSMFMDCTSLTTAPILPASTLVKECYETMFYGCTNLTYIKMLAYDGFSSDYEVMIKWVTGVSSTGTFIKHPDADLPRGESGIPNGWTVGIATE